MESYLLRSNSMYCTHSQCQQKKIICKRINKSVGLYCYTRSVKLSQFFLLLRLICCVFGNLLDINSAKLKIHVCW